MTLPRRHLPFEAVMLVRRTHERRFLLGPTADTRAIIAYEVARAAVRHQQNIHGAVSMGNHVHFVLHDTCACRSDFMRDAMSGVARQLNRHLGREGYVWDARSYGETLLLDANALERMLVYTWLNPVAAGLVDSPYDWPGFIILPRDWGKTIRIPRPNDRYGRNAPDFIEFTPQPPPGYENQPLKKTIAHFERLLEEGLTHILKARPPGEQPSEFTPPSPTERPSTPSPRSPRRPRFASANPALRLQAEQQHRDFQNLYRRQRQRWKQGQRRQKCVFPPGTLWLRRHAPIRCAATPHDSIGIFLLERAPVSNAL
ncbi:hypothetical protein [Lujinxingia litoralis]|uniref:hypothetical protein n=1 Tax=Lujinxingia litoralis TaxID=2211119 RepID=UPI0011B93936|nr:hypothetical protein [Lujinxingia litoralis]